MARGNPFSSIAVTCYITWNGDPEEFDLVHISSCMYLQSLESIQGFDSRSGMELHHVDPRAALRDALKTDSTRNIRQTSYLEPLPH
jgi:hypothetical protein